MRDILSFPVLLAAYIAGSVVLHQLVLFAGLTGLPSFLVYCVPLIAVLAHTTAGDDESYIHALLRIAAWGYSFILAIAAVAWLIDRGFH